LCEYVIRIKSYSDRANFLSTVRGYLAEDGQTDMWNQARLSVWKQNRSSAKEQKYLELTGGGNS